MFRVFILLYLNKCLLKSTQYSLCIYLDMEIYSNIIVHVEIFNPEWNTEIYHLITEMILQFVTQKMFFFFFQSFWRYLAVVGDDDESFRKIKVSKTKFGIGNGRRWVWLFRSHFYESNKYGIDSKAIHN